MAAVLDTSCKIRAPGTAMLFVWVKNGRDFHLKSHRKIMGRYKKQARFRIKITAMIR